MSQPPYDDAEAHGVELAHPVPRAEYLLEQTARHIDDMTVLRRVAFWSGVVAVSSFGMEHIEESPTLFTKFNLVAGVFMGALALVKMGLETRRYREEVAQIR